jgi:hypothetical protein
MSMGATVVLLHLPKNHQVSFLQALDVTPIALPHSPEVPVVALGML